jgi:hypothetical protein
MFSLLRWLLLLVVIVGAVGWYRGWFTLSNPQPDAKSDKVNISVSVDEGKVKADIERAKRKINEEAKQLQDRTKAK